MTNDARNHSKVTTNTSYFFYYNLWKNDYVKINFFLYRCFKKCYEIYSDVSLFKHNTHLWTFFVENGIEYVWHYARLIILFVSFVTFIIRFMNKNKLRSVAPGTFLGLERLYWL